MSRVLPSVRRVTKKIIRRPVHKNCNYIISFKLSNSHKTNTGFGCYSPMVIVVPDIHDTENPTTYVAIGHTKSCQF